MAMSESDSDGKRTTITAATVRAAVRDAAAGRDYVRRDTVVGGLELQVRYGKVSWSLRTRLFGAQKRYKLGHEDVATEVARMRAIKVKDLCKSGIDPKRTIVEMLTGVSVTQQRREEAERPIQSIPWEEARDWFLGEIRRTRSIDTWDDYRKKLENVPELADFAGRMVATITAGDVGQVLKKVADRAGYPMSEGLQRTLSSMWTRLADPAEAGRTGVKPHAIRHAKAPERPAPNIYADPDEEDLSNPPTLLELGRAIAIAKSGALGLQRSAAILLLAGSVQRRRTVVGANRTNFRTFENEECWAIPPFFRKTAKKKRSQAHHIIPLVGWAAEAKRVLDRLAPKEQDWLLPAGKSVKSGKKARTPHMNASTLTTWMLEMPGLELSPHPWRAAIATYGPQHLGWASGDAKLLLDHLEGFDGGDVTAQHYNTNPDVVKKRKMLAEWISFLDRCEREAIAADPELADAERIAEAAYLKRNGEAGHKAALKRAAKQDGKLPWSSIERLIVDKAVVESLDVWRRKRMPA